MSRRDDVELRRASARLAVQFSALIVVLFAMLGVVLYAIVSESQSQAIQRTLSDASKIDSPRDAPSGSFVIIVNEGAGEGAGTSPGAGAGGMGDGDGDAAGGGAGGGAGGAAGDGAAGGSGAVQASPDLPTGLPDQHALDTVAGTRHDQQQTKTLGGRTFIIGTFAMPGRVTQVAVDLRESQQELQRLAWALAISGALAAVAAGLISVWISRRAMRPLADALALQRRFVMDASHELRTPLTLLSTRAQLLRRRLVKAAAGGPGGTDGASNVVVPDDGASAVTVATAGMDEIVQDARVLGEILEDLLIAADPREMADRTSLDLAALADEVVGSLHAEAESRGVTLERTGASDAVAVTAARVSILRLFTALTTNALDHANVSVKVEVTADGRGAMIRVIDDGPGFPEGMDARAFERFASSRPASEEPGQPRHYGLGLALVAEVVARHGGTVSVEKPGAGHGGVVVVTLPENA